MLSGQNSPLPQLASLLRRLQRKSAEAPGLLDDVVKSLDEALIHLDAAQSGVDAALRATEFDPRTTRTRRGAAFFACAPPRANSPFRSKTWPRLRDTMVADLADLDAGEENSPGWRSRPPPRATPTTALLRGSPSCASRPLLALKKAVMAELPALKLERAEFLVEISSEPDNRTETGVDQVEFWVRTNPGTRPGPMMKVASGGELLAFPAGAEGRARRPRLGADAGFRRDRHRRRRRRRRRDRPAPRAGCRRGSRCCPSPTRRRSRRAPRRIS